jgi:serine/threonine protein kinase
VHLESFHDWRPIVHRGIKLENILAMTNRTIYPSLKLGDFGISKKYNPDNTDRSCDTCIWQPPEIPRISTPAADVWALGAIIHFLALGNCQTSNVLISGVLQRGSPPTYNSVIDSVTDLVYTFMYI